MTSQYLTTISYCFIAHKCCEIQISKTQIGSHNCIILSGSLSSSDMPLLHRWNSCKQNKQAANNRAATNNQMVTPEGEKLHSDSGISVDSQSLQEQQQQQQQQQQAQAEVQAQPSHSHTQEQIGKLKTHSLFFDKKKYVNIFSVSALCPV